MCWKPIILGSIVPHRPAMHTKGYLAINVAFCIYSVCVW